MKYLLLLSVFIVGCGRFEAIRHVYIEEELEVYVAEFEQDYGVEVRHSVTFKQLGDRYAGLCTIRGNDRNVYIDTDFYDRHKNNYHAMHQLIYHELGHCTLGLGHDDRTLHGEPVSIMNSYAFGMFSYYKDNLEAYKEQLWTNYRGLETTSTNSKTFQHDCHTY